MKTVKLKIVFLDIHGVLTSAGSVEVFGTNTELDPVSVGLLRRIVSSTGARIVVTSNMRKTHTFAALREFLRAAGGKRLSRAVLDVLGDDALPRGELIQQWIDINELAGAYAVIDDGLIVGHEGHVVACSGNYGLQFPEYSKALSILSGEPPNAIP